MNDAVGQRVILITDPRWSLERILEVVRALRDTPVLVQHRDKESPLAKLEEDAARIREVARVFVLNAVRPDADEVIDLAFRLGADGVHAKAKTALWTSVPAHDDEDLTKPADALLVSPIFATPGKGEPRGTAALERAGIATAGKPTKIYALGGITPASGCASSSSITLASGAASSLKCTTWLWDSPCAVPSTAVTVGCSKT